MKPATLPKFPRCSECGVLRPEHQLTGGACTDQTLCARLKRRGEKPIGALDQDSDPPLVATTRIHRTKRDELAAVTVEVRNGKGGHHDGEH